MSNGKENNPSKGCVPAILFIVLLCVLAWVYGETDKAGDLAGGLMKIIMVIAAFAVLVIYEKDKKGK
ncbi:MAG: hypothetical protein RLZZ172_490 [Bacteroidota bacterium]|jgi:cell division protein FtsW (lipid II flippase)